MQKYIKEFKDRVCRACVQNAVFFIGWLTLTSLKTITDYVRDQCMNHLKREHSRQREIPSKSPKERMNLVGIKSNRKTNLIGTGESRGDYLTLADPMGSGLTGQCQSL